MAKHILFVEDSREYLSTIRHLASEYYESLEVDNVIHSARSIEEARRIMHEYRLDRVVSDWKMRDGDGIDFLEEVHKQNPKADLVLLSGFATALFSDEHKRKLEQLKIIGASVRNKGADSKTDLEPIYDLTNKVIGMPIDPGPYRRRFTSLRSYSYLFRDLMYGIGIAMLMLGSLLGIAGHELIAVLLILSSTSLTVYLIRTSYDPQ